MAGESLSQRLRHIAEFIEIRERSLEAMEKERVELCRYCSEPLQGVDEICGGCLLEEENKLDNAEKILLSRMKRLGFITGRKYACPYCLKFHGVDYAERIDGLPTRPDKFIVVLKCPEAGEVTITYGVTGP